MFFLVLLPKNKLYVLNLNEFLTYLLFILLEITKCTSR